MKAVRHYLLDIPDVRRNHTLLFFPLKIISVKEIYSDSLFMTRKLDRREGRVEFIQWANISGLVGGREIGPNQVHLVLLGCLPLFLFVFRCFQ